MKKKIALLTGARSEYGIVKTFLRSLRGDRSIGIDIYVNGMHNLKKFGHTISEIKKDGFRIKGVINTYTESGKEKAVEFADSIRMIYSALKGRKYDAVLVVGDRLEAYAASLASHFLGLPVIHLGGGAVTNGAVDNIYRYNITNLASLHFPTSRPDHCRLLRVPGIDKRNVRFTGSCAIDSIIKFKKNPVKIADVVSGLNNDFVLMTFHPVTAGNEPIDKIMDSAIELIIKSGYDLLVTYPNNDTGHEKIIKVIEKWSKDKRVHAVKNLGAEYYYAAMGEASLIIGNSSSGVIEAPYFNKKVINVGSRQSGRPKDRCVEDVRPTSVDVASALKRWVKGGRAGYRSSNIYGGGNSSDKMRKAILSFLK